MGEFLQHSLDTAAKQAPAWLSDVLSNGRRRWEASRWPDRKTEQWKYTSLQALQQEYHAADTSAQLPDDMTLPQLAGNRLVFVDGNYSAELSHCDSHIDVVRFQDASAEQAERIREHLGTALNGEQHIFAALNDAALQDGLLLDIPADTIIDEPLQLVWFSSQCSAAFNINQRTLVLAGKHSRAEIIEQFISADGSQAFTNGITELILADNAALAYLRLHEERRQATHIGGVHALLARDSRLDAFHMALGSDLKRLDLVVQYVGPGAHCDLNGIYLPRGKEHIDYHTCIEHAVAHCSTDEAFRGIISDEATAVFNGRIHIHENAQKTRAELSNKNLLTSDQATVNSKPELEIYADDVQCAHGATVAQLDETSLHYLRTRGVPKDEAEVMLSFGFINELVDNIGNESVRNYLRPLLAQQFSADPDLTRHLV